MRNKGARIYVHARCGAKWSVSVAGIVRFNRALRSTERLTDLAPNNSLIWLATLDENYR